MISDMLGFSDSDYAYNQQRAHSADLLFFKIRAWFWGSFATLSALLVGNIMGVFDINIMGWIIDTLWHSWEL
jgi:hypothetical protein|tara:strand:+ start:1070 stop:1285 length:216 start_codon:yes stop_codon:yes gene_type:complete